MNIKKKKPNILDKKEEGVEISSEYMKNLEAQLGQVIRNAVKDTASRMNPAVSSGRVRSTLRGMLSGLTAPTDAATPADNAENMPRAWAPAARRVEPALCQRDGASEKSWGTSGVSPLQMFVRGRNRS